MQILSLLNRLAVQLSAWDGYWAICGGIAASLYRELPRYTNDIDIAILDAPHASARTIAECVIKAMGYTSIVGFVPNGSGEQQLALIVCRELKDMSNVTGIDFLLPILPWIPAAVARAQSNKIDYGFSPLPTITPEDLIIAKLFAVQRPQPRAIDYDDIQAILKDRNDLDKGYIVRQTEMLNIRIPVSLVGEFFY